MRFTTGLIQTLSAMLIAGPPVPCCAAAIHWANFR